VVAEAAARAVPVARRVPVVWAEALGAQPLTPVSAHQQERTLAQEDSRQRAIASRTLIATAKWWAGHAAYRGKLWLGSPWLRCGWAAEGRLAATWPALVSPRKG